MDLLLTPDEKLTLRDGTPWDAGRSAHSRPWPLPQTLAGMLRSRAGLARGADFFQKGGADIIEREVGLGLQLPLLETCAGRQLLFPAPADAVCFPTAERTTIEVCTPRLHSLSDPWCDGLPADWLAPVLDRAAKPDAEAPRWWCEAAFMGWVCGEFPGSAGSGVVARANLGRRGPLEHRRLHTAIDAATFTAKDGKLFGSHELRFRDRDESWHIALRALLENPDDAKSLTPALHLGGDTQTVVSSAENIAWPVFPEGASWEKQEFLKIRLLTPGDFGSWVPDWLTPGDWRTVPGTQHVVKLRSAFVPGGMPVSGWDFKARGPKATRLLVPAGSVYVVQLREPDAAAALARHLWLAPLVRPAVNRQATGFGHVVPGLLHHSVTPL